MSGRMRESRVSGDRAKPEDIHEPQDSCVHCASKAYIRSNSRKSRRFFSGRLSITSRLIQDASLCLAKDSRISRATQRLRQQSSRDRGSGDLGCSAPTVIENGNLRLAQQAIADKSRSHPCSRSNCRGWTSFSSVQQAEKDPGPQGHPAHHRCRARSSGDLRAALKLPDAGRSYVLEIDGVPGAPPTHSGLRSASGLRKEASPKA